MLRNISLWRTIVVKPMIIDIFQHTLSITGACTPVMYIVLLPGQKGFTIMLSLRNVCLHMISFFLFGACFSSMQWFLCVSFVSQIFIHRRLALISQHQKIMLYHLGYQCGFFKCVWHLLLNRQVCYAFNVHASAIQS